MQRIVAPHFSLISVSNAAVPSHGTATKPRFSAENRKANRAVVDLLGRIAPAGAASGA